MKEPQHYVERFLGLHRDGIPGRWPRSTTNKAPHKPLLLTVVTDQYIAGRQHRNFVELTDALEEKFQDYWFPIFGGRQKSTIALPFYHLQNDGFWHLVSNSGKRELPEAPRKSFSALRALISGSTLDEELHQLLLQPQWAAHLRSVLITTYFTPELHSLFFRH